MSNQKDQKKDRSINTSLLIVFIILILLIGLGGFFLGRWLYDHSTKTEVTDVFEIDEGAEANNRLLKLLNDNINKTKVGEEKPASEITTFSFKEKHFYITGCSDVTIYQYDLNLTTKSYTSTKEALDFIMKNDVEGEYEITLNRYTPSESNEFVTRYVTENVTGPYRIGVLGEDKYAFATLLNGEQITVIDGDTLSDTLQANYSPKVINKTDPLFNIYKYLVTK